jgi:lipopolysaccharide/colanic/teichoic acid biosynthesis glycosyltransferase
MKRFIKYWLWPLIWAALFFPVWSSQWSQTLIWNLSLRILRLFYHTVNDHTLGLAYTIARKSGHVIEYAVLAYLLFRAFRRGRADRWRWTWAIAAGLLAAGYGALDEYVQTFVPGRHGSPIDWGVDAAAILLMLFFVHRQSRRPEKRLARPARDLKRALFLKRPFDVLLSGFGILLSSPLWVLFSAVIRLQDRGPIFYKQDRVGKGGRIFGAVKFRSMIKDAEMGRGAVQAVENDPRVTRFGRVLRATAMDELPQLLNIFRGDMSFVGPRALRPAEKEVHGDEDVRRIEDIPGYAERTTVRPGLTGFAQVYLSGDAPRRKKFLYDGFYIRNRSFWWDLELILLSFGVTFRGKWESRQKKI